ncbi:hypothetical protein [Aestuariimicrobium kwangyangense]|uniref:hypothetical protein n=1 Tax=Aestuariimicrobium kwangyangense TaxID=396389 RepID=UPI0003B61E0F|nr:hypothetical protein [Aestuariimicrobium kwangyangense]
MPDHDGRPPAAPTGRNSTLAPLLGCGVILVVVAVLVFAVFQWLRRQEMPQVVPPANQCVVTVGPVTYSMSPEQAKWASVIVAESIRRGLPARAASIALATAMQESGLRNLDHGDRDSVGLFQQRPSQGWGSVDQIMDPWYASGKFYEHLVKVANWQTGDINDVAQSVQRSGVPDGYRKHVENAKALASALTGHSPGALTCLNRDSPETPEPVVITQVFGTGLKGRASLKRSGDRWTITAKNPQDLWAAVNLSLATIDETPIGSITVAGRTWQHDPDHLAVWSQATASPTPAAGTATLTVTGSTPQPSASQS